MFTWIFHFSLFTRVDFPVFSGDACCVFCLATPDCTADSSVFLSYPGLFLIIKGKEKSKAKRKPNMISCHAHF